MSRTCSASCRAPNSPPRDDRHTCASPSAPRLSYLPYLLVAGLSRLSRLLSSPRRSGLSRSTALPNARLSEVSRLPLGLRGFMARRRRTLGERGRSRTGSPRVWSPQQAHALTPALFQWSVLVRRHTLRHFHDPASRGGL